MTDAVGVEASDLLYPNGYLLKSLGVYNWGPFHERHQVSIDLHGTAIIGATGSGKTTLVDALMTLICATPRYNLASTGGHDSDRDLISYIRGKAGEGNSVDEKHIARPSKTYTGIEATFSNGEQQISLAGLFWVDGNSNSASDLKRRWIFNQDSQYSLDHWLSLLHEEDARSLKQLAKETSGLMVTENKKTYLAQVRRFFEVGNNAFTLLNRAAGMKQLNSIDELFRELVLDDHSKFVRATEVVASFDTLSTIYSELQIARDQRDSLLPIKSEFENFNNLQDKSQIQEKLKAATPIWFAQHTFDIWQQEHQSLKQIICEKQLEIESLNKQIAQAESNTEVKHSLYLNLGGGNIEILEQQLADSKQVLKESKASRDSYLSGIKKLNLASKLTAQSFAQNHTIIQTKLTEQEKAFEEQNTTFINAQTDFVNLERSASETLKNIQQAKKRPDSSVPEIFDHYRQLLAEAIGLDKQQLPFLAELIEVKSSEKIWRGAIERAIGSHRLRILVPQASMKMALNWVNQRDNKLHVRLFEVKTHYETAHFMDDGFTRKLNFKQHQHREAVKSLLANIDRHCIQSADDLQGVSYGMTQQGLMSARSGYYEKQDQKPLNHGWMTGFNNQDLLKDLQRQHDDFQPVIATAKIAKENEALHLADLGKKCQELQNLLSLEYSHIDTLTQSQIVARLEERLQALRSPDSDTEKAKQAWEESKKITQGLRNNLTILSNKHAVLKNQSMHAEQTKQHAFDKIKSGLSEKQTTLCETYLEQPTSEQKEQLDELEKIAVQKVQKTLDALVGKIGKCSSKLVNLLNQAKKKDTGALSESGTDLIDIPDYLQRLDVLIKEALPEKIKEFQQYLNDSSDQTVVQILHEVDSEVDRIEERIEDLNNTMQQVDFQPGRFLRLESTQIEHNSLKKLKAAQNNLRSARLQDDEGESHYKALKNVVTLLQEAAENKKRVGSLALLDPRYRLQFNVSIISRKDFSVIEKRSGSQSGSGGEKEVITSYILTASLSYALCPEGARKPLFSTIVLDEAFSKTSQKAASSIILALRQFGLHPLFVTPNKEMQLLRTHTRSAVLIHRKGMRATTTSFSWEELQKKSQQIINTQQ